MEPVENELEARPGTLPLPSLDAYLKMRQDMKAVDDKVKYQDAHRAFYLAFFPAVRRKAHRHLADLHNVEEVVQKVFTLAFEPGKLDVAMAGKKDTPSACCAWLLLVARNIAVDEVRRQVRERKWLVKSCELLREPTDDHADDLADE